jgi:hypothetical protein
LFGCSDALCACPSLAPRAFEDIFQIVRANEKKFKFTVQCYMIELYCDKLIDLFAPKVRTD